MQYVILLLRGQKVAQPQLRGSLTTSKNRPQSGFFSNSCDKNGFYRSLAETVGNFVTFCLREVCVSVRASGGAGGVREGACADAERNARS